MTKSCQSTLKSKRLSNRQPNCLKTNKNTRSGTDNKLTQKWDNKFIRCKDVDSNSNKDINNHQRVTLTYLYTQISLYQLLQSPRNHINSFKIYQKIWKLTTSNDRMNLAVTNKKLTTITKYWKVEHIITSMEGFNRHRGNNSKFNDRHTIPVKISITTHDTFFRNSFFFFNNK